jgi:hypothetical protein
MNNINNKFYDEIKNMIKKIDLSKINIKLIKNNCNNLLEIYNKLNNLWININNKNIDYNIINSNESKYNEIKKILIKNFLSENTNIKKIITQSKYIHHLKYLNINFFWLSDNEKKNIDDEIYLMSLNMFKITLSLNQYKYKNNDNMTRYIIWIPINKERNYNYNIINEKNLKKTENDFEAFVASGVTFNLNPRITIITRFEEVEKLLIHELIHNYHMDGSIYHNELSDIIDKYRLIKNNNNKKKNYDYEYSIYESYTELLSTYFYLLFNSIKQNIILNEEKILGQILIELIYSYNLICNLIDLNNYTNYNEFKKKIFFGGNICGYEYYYLKALMYNNYNLLLGSNLEDYINIYTNILKMIKKIQNHDDYMMEEIYNKRKKQYNFKYQIH